MTTCSAGLIETPSRRSALAHSARATGGKYQTQHSDLSRLEVRLNGLRLSLGPPRSAMNGSGYKATSSSVPATPDSNIDGLALCREGDHPQRRGAFINFVTFKIHALASRKKGNTNIHLLHLPPFSSSSSRATPGSIYSPFFYRCRKAPELRLAAWGPTNKIKKP